MFNKETLKRLKQAVRQAQIRQDLDTARNPDLQRAIKIVEEFLRKSKRVCYGGQAINVQLPFKDQFYNLETSLPDYDFFTPDDKSDIDSLIEHLKEAGFKEISKKVGIHDGTTKIYVNYTAIADITKIDGDFYDQIEKRSIIIEGIHYADPIFLRMMMFLELSRPKGMLTRWEKVFERLSLLEKAHPLKLCRGDKPVLESKEATLSRATILRYIIKNSRSLMGANISSLYKSGSKSASSRTKFLLHGKAPLVFFSPDAQSDADTLSIELGTTTKEVLGYQNILPAMVELYSGENMVCIIVQEEACHSFINIPLTKQRNLRVASLDTLLAFLIGLYYRDDHILMNSESILCWISEYVLLLNRYRQNPTSLVPSFAIDCSGYQTSFASLLRAKGVRIEAERQKVGSGFRTTMKRKRGLRKTRKRY